MRTITLAVLLCAVLALAYQPALFARWDQKAKDAITRCAGGGTLSNRVVIVAIDDSTLAQFGRWPWPRDRLSELLKKIQVARPDTVVLDMMFPEPDLGKPTAEPRPLLAAEPASRVATNDDVLAATLREGRFVIGFHLRFGPQTSQSATCPGKPLRLTIVDSESRRAPPFFTASGVTCSIKELENASVSAGFLNASADHDRLLRRIPLLLEHDGNAYPSLALAGYLASRRIDAIQLWTNSAGASSLRIGRAQVPLDSKSALLLRFRGPAGRFPRISAGDVINGNAPPAVLAGKIVVVGISATGLQDVVSTPVDPIMPGFEAHATAMDNLLQGDAYRVPRGAFAAELGLLFVMAITSGLLISRIGVIWAPLAIAVLLLLTWLGPAALVRITGIVVSPFPASMALIGNLALLSTWRLMTEKRREEQQLKTTRQFILQVLTTLTGIRDLETGAHIMRVQRYAKLLCQTLAADPRYRRVLTRNTIELIYEVIPVHDVGKVAIPDRILRYPGPLSREDFEVIRTHVMQGYKVLADAAERCGLQDEPAIRLAADIILAHHERWNGTGYPRGLEGEAIPLAGRIAAVADVYDALVCKRVYKERLSHEVAVDFIVKNRAILFDPAIVDAFVKVQNEMRSTKLSFDDDAALAASR